MREEIRTGRYASHTAGLGEGYLQTNVVILPEAFTNDQIKPEAWRQVIKNLDAIRGQNGQTSFAVRSSALAEDSAYASFAGEFETVLDVHTDEAVRAAIQQVHHSKASDRVKAYSEAKGIDQEDHFSTKIRHNPVT